MFSITGVGVIPVPGIDHLTPGAVPARTGVLANKYAEYLTMNAISTL